MALSSEDAHTAVTILGSGTCVPSLERSSAAAFVKVGTSRILLDIGAGTIHRLVAAGHSIFDVSHVFITHFHPDHTGELVPFLFSNKYPDGSLRKHPLTIVGGPGFSNFFKKLTAVYGQWVQLSPEKVRIMEAGLNGMRMLDFDNFSLSWAPVSHSPESIAYRIQDSTGKTLVYSGDTDVSDSLEELAKDADLLICESALPDDLKSPGHLTPSLAGRIAAGARVRKLVLTHFYPECDGEDLIGQCRRTFDGPLVLAEDLMEMEL